MELQKNSLDGMYSRWALAWIPNAKEILTKVYQALKPGGRMVIHEYYDWSSHQTEPVLPHLSRAITAAYKSFSDMEGDLNIGRHIPRIFNELGMEVKNTRLMAKLATPKDLAWQWPKSFYKSYFPRLAEIGYLSNEDVKNALKDLERLEQTPGATICCPLMLETVGVKREQ
jgi:ubiquinone/menaquinone biosynthesis C-methylase UbiE